MWVLPEMVVVVGTVGLPLFDVIDVAMIFDHLLQHEVLDDGLFWVCVCIHKYVVHSPDFCSLWM